MKEEDLIKKMTEGAPNPFRVPDGYFENFTSRVMKALPAQEAKTERKTLFLSHLWRYAAAIVIVLAFGLAFLYSEKKGETVAESAQQEYYQEEYINDALDYAMVDNQEIEMYLTEAQ